MNLEESKVLMNIEKYGNTPSATYLWCLMTLSTYSKDTIILQHLVEDSLGIYLLKMGIRQ
jgi:3-oxoacyl-[acyl-carrier-protein] synthase III